MLFVLWLSITIRILGLVGAILLFRRVRDWRAGILALTIVLMTLRQLFSAYHFTPDAESDQWAFLTEIPGLFVSLIAVYAVFALGKMFDERDQIETESRRHVQHLRLTLEQIPLILWTTDNELRFTSGVGAGLENMELAPDELVGMRLQDYFRTGDPSYPAILNHRLALEGEQRSFEFTWQDHTYEAHVRPFRNDEKEIVGTIGIALDITQRRLTEEQLIASEERFAMFMMHLPGLAMMKDEEHRMIYLNQAFRTTFDIKFDDWLGKTVNEVLPPETAAEHRKNDEWVIRRQDALQTIETIEHKGKVHQYITCKFPIHRPGKPTILGVISIDISERMKAEAELKQAQRRLEKRVEERTAELKATNKQLEAEIAERKEVEKALREEQEHLRQLYETQEHDRKRIAYEIHDGIVQYATGAHLQLEALLDRVSPEQKQDIAPLADLMRKTVQEGRDLINGLRPPVLDQHGLVAGLDHLVNETKKTFSEVEFFADARIGRLLPALESALYRITQESLTNAIKYSQSPEIEIRLRMHENMLRLEIEDWGIGFDPEAVPQDHHGIRGMKERVRAFGGVVRIDTTQGEGTHITVELPILTSEKSTVEI